MNRSVPRRVAAGVRSPVPGQPDAWDYVIGPGKGGARAGIENFSLTEGSLEVDAAPPQWEVKPGEVGNGVAATMLPGATDEEFLRARWLAVAAAERGTNYVAALRHVAYLREVAPGSGHEALDGWAEAWLEARRPRLELLSLPAPGAGTGARLRLFGLPGQRYVLEASTDLAGWLPLGSHRPTAATLDLTDPAGPVAGPRFFRMTWFP